MPDASCRPTLHGSSKARIHLTPETPPVSHKHTLLSRDVWNCSGVVYFSTATKSPLTRPATWSIYCSGGFDPRRR